MSEVIVLHITALNSNACKKGAKLIQFASPSVRPLMSVLTVMLRDTDHVVNEV